MPKPSSKKPDKKHVSITRLFPNMVTLLAMCIGLSSIRFALDEKWETALICVIAAAILDGLDGGLARLLNAQSSFGAELDSLSDLMNFGFSPAFLMFLWSMHDVRALGWATVLLFTVCTAIRLARFNTDLEAEDPPKWKKYYFEGVPSPCGALLAVAPIVFHMAFSEHLTQYKDTIAWTSTPLFTCGWLALIAFFMTSRLPTFSIKNIQIRTRNASALLVISTLMAIALITIPWLFLAFIGAIYVLSMPLVFLRAMRLR